jgi:kynurenine formamidase
MSVYPKYSELPNGCAWGVFDKDGVKDTVGTINFLTADVVVEANKEVQVGEHVQLDWSLDKPEEPFFGRKVFERKILDKSEPGEMSCDDELHINTQSSSQWDSLFHFGHCATSSYYNGVNMASILKDKPEVCAGIDAWVKRGGIVGRGVLLDYVAYAKRKNISFAPTDSHAISMEALEEIAKQQQVEIKPGDILIVRTGLTEWYDNASKEERELTKKGTFAGLEAGSDTAKWLWDHRVAAVASDAPAVEVWPPKQFDGHALHYHLIAMCGMPLGELWDLSKLAKTCQRLGRYSFFFTSAPLNVPNGIGTPPNAIAIF